MRDVSDAIERMGIPVWYAKTIVSSKVKMCERGIKLGSNDFIRFDKGKIPQCLTFRRTFFRKMISRISDKSVKIRWSGKAIDLLQLITEREILHIVLGATAIALNAGRQTILENDVMTSYYIGHQWHTMRIRS